MAALEEFSISTSGDNSCGLSSLVEMVVVG